MIEITLNKMGTRKKIVDKEIDNDNEEVTGGGDNKDEKEKSIGDAGHP